MMVVNRRKKNSRQRGSKTHGWGSMKKHRGAGNKGGSGRAGSGKRADSKKPSLWTDKRYFGKHGFTKKGIAERITPINIDYLEQKLPLLLSKKLVSQENDVYTVDLKKIGFNKLLSSGKVTKKFRITVPYASKRAVEKIKKRGGEVIGLLAKAEG
jgi:large subunit ribosomal protein L15